MQQPGEGDLRRRRPLAIGNVAHNRCRAHVRVEVLALIAWVVTTEIVVRILLGALHVPSQESAPQWRKRNESDAELAQERNDPRLEVAFPKRVLALQRGNRVHRVRTTDRLLRSEERRVGKEGR